MRKSTLIPINCVSVIGNCATVAGLKVSEKLSKVSTFSLLKEITNRVESENFRGFKSFERDKFEDLLSTKQKKVLGCHGFYWFHYFINWLCCCARPCAWSFCWSSFPPQPGESSGFKKSIGIKTIILKKLNSMVEI